MLVSVIMPIRNEVEYIQRSLNAVLAQTYPADRIEILVVDGMSTDGTRELVASLIAARPDRVIRLIDNPSQIVPPGLNRALQQARGQIIVRIDGHCRVARNYVELCVANLIEKGADAVGGPIDTIGETRISGWIALAMSTPFGVGGSSFRTVKDRALWVDTVAFPAYRMETIRRIGLFDEELVRNQDDEYNYRLRQHGGRILLAPEIRSEYFSRSSVIALWRQYFQYGYWKVRVMQKHPRQMQVRQFVPPIFVGLLLFLLALTVILPWGYWFFLGYLLCYLLAGVVVTLRTISPDDWPAIPILLVLYAVLHISYGFGFLYGLLRFVHRWKDRTGMVPALEHDQ